jgi:hypothetical protein
MRCEPGANAFIERVFQDCIYSTRDMASFCFGLTSIALWVFAAVPQFISNYQNQSSEALSVWFLTQVNAGALTEHTAACSSRILLIYICSGSWEIH